MHALRQILLPVLLERQDELALTLCTEVKNSSAVHYRELATDLLNKRCNSAVEAFCNSIKTSPAMFGDYIADITKERIEAGYQLDELQLLLNTLEELLWKLSIDTIEDQDELIKALSVVSGTVGLAKDRVAKVFLARTIARVNHAPDVDRLFLGT